MDQTTTSPVPPSDAPDKPFEMDFPQAMKAIIEGSRIARVGWNNPDFAFLNPKDGMLTIYTSSDGQFHSWTLTDGDILTTDWIVLPEVKLNT